VNQPKRSKPFHLGALSHETANARSFRAYLFDCDGTIADSMPLHYIAWKKALAEWNCAL
jgi:hypothetical protein